VKNKNLIILLLVLAIAILAGVNIYSSKSNSETEEKIIQLQKDLEILKDDYLMLDANLISLNDLNVHLTAEVNMFRNPDIKTFIILSNDIFFEGTKVIVCWNKKDFSIMVSAEQLPKLEDKQFFQLWALSNGKYIKAKSIPASMNGNFIKLEAKISLAETFILTIENSNENTAPSLEKPYLSENPLIKE
jgi:hypothetical protein